MLGPFWPRIFINESAKDEKYAFKTLLDNELWVAMKMTLIQHFLWRLNLKWPFTLSKAYFTKLNMNENAFRKI